MRVGFIGLGIMGLPMARNLLEAGHEVTAFTRSGVPEDLGASAAGSAADAARGAEIVILMLPDGPDVHAVALGEDGVINAMDEGAILVDCSSISPAAAREVHEAGAARGIRVLDAPVSGGEAGAIEGVLSIMVGGEESVLAEAMPALEAVGGTIRLVGGPGSGQVVKAANQLIVAGNLQVLSEAVVLLQAQGVELAGALEVLGAGLAGSTVLQRKSATMQAGTYDPGFRLELHRKDLRIVEESARASGLGLPVTAVTSSLVSALCARGDAGLDHSALLKLARELNGLPQR